MHTIEPARSKHKSTILSTNTPSTKPTKMSQTNNGANMVVDIMMVVDRSGSMASMGPEVMNGFNAFVETQCTTQEESLANVRLTTIRFDNEVEVVHDRLPIKDVPKATPETFRPRSMTALFDAVGHGVNMMKKYMGSKVIFVILTDGQENASNKVTKGMFQEMVQGCQAQGWEFVFLAANQDAIAVGSDFGIRGGACMTFDANAEACQATMSSLGIQVQRSVAAPDSNIEFSTLERQTSAPSQYPKNPVQDMHTPPMHVQSAPAALGIFGDEPAMPQLTRQLSYKPPSHVYALLGAECVNEENDDENNIMHVIVRFESQLALDQEVDNFFDELPDTFAQGLPSGWAQDDQIEVSRMVSEKEANEKGFIAFKR